MSEIIEIVSSQNNIFEDEFLEEYLSRGFGSLSKRDIDIFVMHLLMKHSNLKNESNFDLSMKLKLTETRIKNLKYEAHLKYAESSKDDIKEEFLSLLNKVKLQVVGNETWISIVVEDTFLRNVIKAKVKENGSFVDGSFNSEIVKISVDDFSYLIYVSLDEEGREKIEKEISGLFSDKETLEFKDLFKMFLIEAAKGAVNEFGKQGVSLVTSGITDGASMVVEIVRELGSYIE